MAATMTTQKAFLGTALPARPSSGRKTLSTQVVANGKKTDLSKQGLSGVKNEVVRRNLEGVSKYMDKKGWLDSSGRPGKGYGVYRFAKKYGANVDGYSPIYTPDSWSEGGGSYSLGTKGLLAWAGLVATLLAVGATLIYTTSQL